MRCRMHVKFCAYKGTENEIVDVPQPTVHSSGCDFKYLVLGAIRMIADVSGGPCTNLLVDRGLFNEFCFRGEQGNAEAQHGDEGE
jgi:hypothetical protein